MGRRVEIEVKSSAAGSYLYEINKRRTYMLSCKGWTYKEDSYSNYSVLSDFKRIKKKEEDF